MCCAWIHTLTTSADPTRGGTINLGESFVGSFIARGRYWADRPIQPIMLERWLSHGHRVPDPSYADYIYIPLSARSCKQWDDALSYINVSICIVFLDETHAPVTVRHLKTGMQGHKSPNLRVHVLLYKTLVQVLVVC